jgi:hypothetical protein
LTAPLLLLTAELALLTPALKNIGELFDIISFTEPM